jgi:soluble lytic murein transglycosylase-like protein
LRILFAFTVVLSISAPLTTSTARSIDTRIDVAPDFRPVEPKQISTPLGDLAVEAPDQDATGSGSRDAKEQVLATRVQEPAKDEEPAVAKEAAKDDGDDSTVTVEIERVCEALAEAAVEHDLPVGFFARLIWQESRFDQWARSPAGARGVAQFMPPTAAEYGLSDPFDPIESVAASARFLRELRDQFGNLGLAAAAYNAGGGRIKRWLSGESGLPKETRDYVHIITGHPAKRWTVPKPLKVSFALPVRAPCDGVEGLSRDAAAAQHDVRLTERSVELIEEAEAARRAKVAAAEAAKKKKKYAKTAKGRKVAATAKSKASKSKAAKSKLAKSKVAKSKTAKSKSKVRVAAGRGAAGS